MIRILTLIFLVAYADPATAQSRSKRTKLEPVPVLWLIGQSNAGGSTAGFFLANPHNELVHLAHQENVRIWWPGASAQRPESEPGWEEYRTGSFEKINNGSLRNGEMKFGPEAAFGHKAQEYWGEPVYIFKFARVSAVHPDAERSWAKKSEATYPDAMAEWDKAMKALQADGKTPEIRGIFMVHGEWDTNEKYRDGYEEGVTQLIRDLRFDLQAQTSKHLPRDRRPSRRRPIPVVISQLHNRHVPRDHWEAGEEVIRAAQAQVAEDDKHVALVSTDDLEEEDGGKKFHFKPRASLRLGEKLFEALIEMRPKKGK